MNASRIEVITSGLFRWAAFSPQHKVELTSHAVVTDGRLFCFDPIPLEEESFIDLSRRGRPTAIILTNENHERDAVGWRDRWQVPIWISPAANLSIAGLKRFPVDLAEWEGWRIWPLNGGGAGELAFQLAEASLVVFGDAIVNLPERGLELLPEKYCQDRGRLEQRLRELVAEPFEQAVMAHGTPLTTDASTAIARLLSSPTDPGTGLKS